MSIECDEYIEIPILPIRDVIIYPNMVIPLLIGRDKSIHAIELAINNEKKIVLITQKNSLIDNPDISDFFSVGTLASILQVIKLSNGLIKVLIESLSRVHITQIIHVDNCLLASVKCFNNDKLEENKNNVLIRALLNQFETYIKMSNRIPLDAILPIGNIGDVVRIIDVVAIYLPMKIIDKQSILEIINIDERINYLMTIIESEIVFLQAEKRIRNRVKKQIEKSQREYYLNEQMKAIQKELNNTGSLIIDEYAELKQKIHSIKMPSDIQRKVEEEFRKLRNMPAISSEATVVRTYIDCLLSLPWYKKSKIKMNIIQAQDILNKEHYGLKRVKDCIIEYLAVQNRFKKIKGPILCLIGPPGVGKTSLGKSIAIATGRKYVRISLGGIRDEAEIYGHRRTYIGAMPGKFIQKIVKVGVKNPLVLLDEIDKMCADSRGDPASALLEVLDPEQNISFSDHYLEVDYDLSNVMFVATANSTNIPHPLLDRMEVIQLSSYTEEEKFNIAKKYLLPEQFKRNALKKNEILIEDNALLSIIRYYTREAGVRGLDKIISKLCRKVVKSLFFNKDLKCICINKDNINNFLGAHCFSYGCAEKKNLIGQVTGLAWTELGGDLLTIEATCIPGKGKLIYTGSLGEVMQESIQAALTVVRSRINKFGIDYSFYEKQDIHVHVPEGATPKDGPSAGIAMCTALVSCLTNNPVKSGIAMTGEITLYGKILPIGGLKEKLLAAHRGGIKIVLIPYENKKNLEEIPVNVKDDLKIYTVQYIDEVFNLVLARTVLNSINHH